MNYKKMKKVNKNVYFNFIKVNNNALITQSSSH